MKSKNTSILTVIFFLIALPGLAQTSVPADTVITMRRFTDAFNNGTDYRLSINSKGTLIFKRIANPAVAPSDPRAWPSAPIKTKIPIEKVAVLVAEIERIKFFSLNDRYFKTEDGCPNVFIDQGGVEISIRMNGKTKTIGHYHGCQWAPFGAIYPVELTALENKIDEIIGTKQWLKITWVKPKPVVR